MAAKFSEGGLVTRGRGRSTFQIVKLRTHYVKGQIAYSYDLIEVDDERNRPRRIYGVSEHNLRPAKEATT